MSVKFLYKKNIILYNVYIYKYIRTAHTRVRACERMATLDKFKVIAVINNADSDVNKDFVTRALGKEEWQNSSKKANAVVLEDRGGEVMVHVTELTSKTVRTRLDSEYYLNI